jgi:ABC-type Fe3+ transport system permease subunit
MGVGFLLALFPLIAAIASLDSLGGNGEGSLLQVSWLVAVGRSVMLGVAVCGVAVALGLPVGLLTAVYAIPGWRICLGLMALPLFVPSFLWSIGLSMLRIALGMPDGGVFSGFSGAVVVFSAGAVPLVVMVTLASVRKVSQAEADAVRMAGGEWRLLWYLARSVFPMALAVGMLAGNLTVSVPGL